MSIHTSETIVKVAESFVGVENRGLSRRSWRLRVWGVLL